MLSDVIASVVTTLNAGRATEVPSLIGAAAVEAAGVPPRLVWVPTQDGFENTPYVSEARRQVRQRTAGVDLHIWETSLAACEQLLHDVILALDAQVDSSSRQQRGFYELRSVSWITEGEQSSLGVVCVLAMGFKIPIVAPVPTIATILTTSGTCEIP